MIDSFKQNVLILIFLVLTCNVLLLSVSNVSSMIGKSSKDPGYEIIDCGDAAGKIHKCIRVDPKAGEINDPAKGASYRMIYGQ